MFGMHLKMHFRNLKNILIFLHNATETFLRKKLAKCLPSITKPRVLNELKTTKQMVFTHQLKFLSNIAFQKDKQARTIYLIIIHGWDFIQELENIGPNLY